MKSENFIFLRKRAEVKVKLGLGPQNKLMKFLSLFIFKITFYHYNAIILCTFNKAATDC